MEAKRGKGLMRGQVLGVDTRTGDGIVTGEDGRRYSFKPLDWADRGEPAVGMQVDFETHENRALSIFPVPGASPPPAVAPARPAPAPAQAGDDTRNKYIAALLAFLVGPLGVHRFYTGRTASAIVMVILTCTLFGLFITVPWAFIDMIRYLVMSDREFAERYARKPR
jgi:TM2 domain-containing membrane protein YozV